MRRFIIFLVLLVALATTGIQRKLEVARAAGMPVPPQLDMSNAGLAFAASLAVLLFAATLSRRFVRYLHTVTALCMAGLVLVDAWHSRQIPLPYALNGTLLNLVVVYVASQLRFATASVLGVVSSLSYLCCMAARHAPMVEGNPVLQLQMGVTLTILACANLLLMFVTHQRELSARLAYHRERLLEERGAELEAALSGLKRAEAQLVENEKQATMGRLVAGILHEMNTPLGALASATHTLTRGLERMRALLGAGSRSAVRQDELLGTLAAAERLAAVQVQSGERIRDVVEGLRQFVSLDRAALQVADVRGGLETAAALIRPSLSSAVELKLDVPEHPIWVQCFPAKLNQVFLNLLENAVEAFGVTQAPLGALGPEFAEPPPAGGEILVSAHEHGGRVSIEVRDTGRGIEAERLPHLFDVDFSRQGSRVKLSLGLPASRVVVEAIGGTLLVQSEVGRGTSVVMDLPLAATPFGARQAAPSRAEPAAPGVERAPVPGAVGMRVRALPSA